jgi:mannose-6-phosphate isomerase-like protein (cupin superfamily)
VEAFYVLEGSATLDIDDERLGLCANEAVIFDPRKLHGLVNTGDRPLRYMVIITQ